MILQKVISSICYIFVSHFSHLFFHVLLLFSVKGKMTCLIIFLPICFKELIPFLKLFVTLSCLKCLFGIYGVRTQNCNNYYFLTASYTHIKLRRDIFFHEMASIQRITNKLMMNLVKLISITMGRTACIYLTYKNLNLQHTQKVSHQHHVCFPWCGFDVTTLMILLPFRL